MDVLKDIAEQVQLGDDERVHALTAQAIEQGMHPTAILNDGLVAGMNVVGKLFKDHEIFLPDVLMAAKAMHAGLDQLKPLFAKEGIPTRGTIVIGTVKGDLHDLGKNLVGIMLKGAGFEVIDLGKDVAPETFVETAVKANARIIGMSALLTTTMPAMKAVIDLLRQGNHQARIKTMIGGAPITKAYADQIGADAYAFDAAKSVDCANALLGG
ncbi:MAG TPA: corrinoid protein [Steroidobacteraceae bacterium]|nr:corrinoid protein [Steroidobacteraceae bacterium]